MDQLKNIKCTHCGGKNLVQFKYQNGEFELIGNQVQENGYYHFVCTDCFHVERFWLGAKTVLDSHRLQKESIARLIKKIDECKKVAQERYTARNNAIRAMLVEIGELCAKVYLPIKEKYDKIMVEFNDDNITVKRHNELQQVLNQLENLMSNPQAAYERYQRRLKYVTAKQAEVEKFFKQDFSWLVSLKMTSDLKFDVSDERVRKIYWQLIQDGIIKVPPTQLTRLKNLVLNAELFQKEIANGIGTSLQTREKANILAIDYYFKTLTFEPSKNSVVSALMEQNDEMAALVPTYNKSAMPTKIQAFIQKLSD